MEFAKLGHGLQKLRNSRWEFDHTDSLVHHKLFLWTALHINRAIAVGVWGM